MKSKKKMEAGGGRVLSTTGRSAHRAAITQRVRCFSYKCVVTAQKEGEEKMVKEK